MSDHPAERVGFARPSDYRRPRCHRRAMLAQLIATSALIVSTAVTTTAVSIGMDRADALAPIHGYGAKLATASLVAVVLTGMGLTAIAAHERLAARGSANRPKPTAGRDPPHSGPRNTK